jgi:2-oxoglutarate dehydrogenase complex dehydrogenase (E1) component-like enzyme
VKKVLFCTGKIYYELAERQVKDNRKDIAILRLEQLYPLPSNQLDALYKKYYNATWFWIQEEPLNMGAASFLQMNLKNINYGFTAVSRELHQLPVMLKCMRRNRLKSSKQRSVFKTENPSAYLLIKLSSSS